MNRYPTLDTESKKLTPRAVDVETLSEQLIPIRDALLKLFDGGRRSPALPRSRTSWRSIPRHRGRGSPLAARRRRRRVFAPSSSTRAERTVRSRPRRESRIPLDAVPGDALEDAVFARQRDRAVDAKDDGRSVHRPPSARTRWTLRSKSGCSRRAGASPTGARAGWCTRPPGPL